MKMTSEGIFTKAASIATIVAVLFSAYTVLQAKDATDESNYLINETKGVLKEVTNQDVIMEKEFGVESISPQVPSFVANDVNLVNQTYYKQPLSESIAISIVSPHYLKVEIHSIDFANPYGPYGNFTTKPAIVMRPIVKYIGNGVTNLEFDVPFNLTLNVNQLHPYSANTTWVGIPLNTTLLLTDLQNKTSPIMKNSTFNYLGISGEYVPKYESPNDAIGVNEYPRVQVNKQGQN